MAITQSQPSAKTPQVALSDCIAFLSALPAESVDLIVTDPAYSGMNRHLQLGRGRIVGRYDERGEADGHWFAEFEDTEQNYTSFLAACERVLKPDRHIFLMFDSYSLLTLGPLVRAQFNLKNVIVWDKVAIGMGHYFRRQSELILFACKGKRPLSRRDIPDVWRIRRLNRAPYPTQKPVEVFEAMVAASKGLDDADFVVCDPFAGSGSSAIAALRQGARFIGCDVSPKAVALANERIAVYSATGEDPLQAKAAYDAKLQKPFWRNEPSA